MTRILPLFLAMLGGIGLAGCRPLSGVTGEDAHSYQELALKAVQDPPGLKKGTPDPPVMPVTSAAVRTVFHPEGRDRPISLGQCIALALENGRVGGESLRVLAYDPAIAGADIEQSLAKFDARWQTNLAWSKIDEPPGLISPGGLAGGGVLEVINEEQARFDTSLVKPLPTGGVAGITFRTDYALSDQITPINSYRPALQFTFEQPLLQAWGVEINQLRTNHPGSLRTPIPTGGGVPGILLTRVLFDEARTDFERRVQDMLLAVEEAYWRLYSSYGVLYSQDAALRQTQQTWQTARIRFEARQLAGPDLAEIEEHYHSLRHERLLALGNGPDGTGVLEAERQLRLAIGLPPEDDERLIPSDTPTASPYVPDWQVAEEQAVALRPELVRARHEVRLAQLVLRREENLLRPDLRSFGSYDLNALGTRLDGPGQDNALRDLASNHFNNWVVGLRLDVPLGFREAHSQVRRANLQLAQRLAALRDQEAQVIFGLQRGYRQLLQAHEEIVILRARRLAAARELKARRDEFQAGLGNIDLLLRTTDTWANAIRAEQSVICDYNIALAAFERDKGTLLVHDNVTIAEGPLPAAVQERASEHFRERDKALVLRERAVPREPAAPLLPDSDEPPPLLPVLEEPGPLPALPAQQAPAPSEPAQLWHAVR